MILYFIKKRKKCVYDPCFYVFYFQYTPCFLPTTSSYPIPPSIISIIIIIIIIIIIFFLPLLYYKNSCHYACCKCVYNHLARSVQALPFPPVLYWSVMVQLPFYSSSPSESDSESSLSSSSSSSLSSLVRVKADEYLTMARPICPIQSSFSFSVSALK